MSQVAGHGLGDAPFKTGGVEESRLPTAPDRCLPVPQSVRLLSDYLHTVRQVVGIASRRCRFECGAWDTPAGC